MIIAAKIDATYRLKRLPVNTVYEKTKNVDKP